MQQTTNYQLPQWEAGDRIRRGDFNDMAQKIDTALKANADAVGALGTPLRMAWGYYVGDGTYGKDNTHTRLEFDFMPIIILIAHAVGVSNRTACMIRGMPYTMSTEESNYTQDIYWENTALHWWANSAESQMSLKNHKYYYIALGYDA